MKSRDISLVPLSAQKFESLRQRSDVACPVGGVPRLGNTYDDPRQSTAFAGYCERFDLATAEGRKAYADLSAKLLPGTELLKLWEERVPGPDGSILVYVSYVRVMEVFHTGTENFDLREALK